MCVCLYEYKNISLELGLVSIIIVQYHDERKWLGAYLPESRILLHITLITIIMQTYLEALDILNACHVHCV